jgi:hypothetical protein
MAPSPDEKETTKTALSETHRMAIIQLVVLWVMTPCSLRHGADQGLLPLWEYLLINLYQTKMRYTTEDLNLRAKTFVSPPGLTEFALYAVGERLNKQWHVCLFQEARGKRPFKIWDSWRNVRKGLVVSSFEELVVRGT